MAESRRAIVVSRVTGHDRHDAVADQSNNVYELVRLYTGLPAARAAASEALMPRARAGRRLFLARGMAKQERFRHLLGTILDISGGRAPRLWRADHSRSGAGRNSRAACNRWAQRCAARRVELGAGGPACA